MRATEEGWLERLRFFLSDFRVEEVPEESNHYVYSADCGTEKVLAGGKVAHGVSTLYRGTLRIFRGRDKEAMAGRLILNLRDKLTDFHQEYVRIRAGGVVLDGGAVVFPARPEPHLPALVALLVKNGGSYVGDEVVHIEPVLRQVRTFPLPTLIDVDDLPLFPELGRKPPRRRKAEDPYAYTPRHPVRLDELGGRAAEAPAPISWLVFPHFEPGAETKLEPAAGAQSLFRFVEAGLNLNIWGDRALVLMRDLLDSTAVSQLTVGSIPEAADLLLGAAPKIMGGR